MKISELSQAIIKKSDDSFIGALYFTLIFLGWFGPNIEKSYVVLNRALGIFLEKFEISTKSNFPSNFNFQTCRN